MRACGISIQLLKLYRNMPVTCSSLGGCISACCIAPRAQDSVSAQQPTARIACSCRQHYTPQTDLPPVSAAMLACSVQQLAARVAQLPQPLRHILQSAAAGAIQQQQLSSMAGQFCGWVCHIKTYLLPPQRSSFVPIVPTRAAAACAGTAMGFALPRCLSLTPEGCGCEHTAYLVPNLPAGSLTLAMEPASTAMGLASP